MKNKKTTLTLLIILTIQSTYPTSWNGFLTSKKILVTSSIFVTVMAATTTYWLTPKKKPLKKIRENKPISRYKTLVKTLFGSLTSNPQQQTPPKDTITLAIEKIAGLLDNQDLNFLSKENEIEKILINKNLKKFYQKAQLYDKKNKTKVAKEIQFYATRLATQNSKN